MGVVDEAYGIQIFPINDTIIGDNIGYFYNPLAVVGDTFFDSFVEYNNNYPGFHNDEFYMPEVFNAKSNRELAADESIIQMQIPYSATIEIGNKLAAMELSSYIIAKLPKSRYVCEFHSIERFLGLLLSMEADFRLIEPVWLREKIVRNAQRVVTNNADEELSETDCEK